MSDNTSDQLRQAGLTAWRTTVLAAATFIVLVLFGGMGYLVYQGQVSEGPLILLTGVILGYILNAVQNIQ